MPYVRRSPDLTGLVAAVAAQYPQEWEAARKRPDGHRDDAFIRRCAWELHQRDGNVGLNGKRGGSDISTDALAYRNPTAPGGAEVIDVITGSHQPAWQDVTIPPVPEPGSKPDLPDGVLGRYIEPQDPGGSVPDVGNAPADVQAEVVALKANCAALADELHAIKVRLELCLSYGSKVGLRMARGQNLSVDLGGPAEPEQFVIFSTRAWTRPWETFELTKPEG